MMMHLIYVCVSVPLNDDDALNLCAFFGNSSISHLIFVRLAAPLNYDAPNMCACSGTSHL